MAQLACGLVGLMGLVATFSVWAGALPDDLCRLTPATVKAALPPWPQVPAQARRVTDFGAQPDDDRPDDAAIAAALAALRPGDWLVFPPGRYLQAHSIRVTVPGVTLWGVGAQLHATDPQDHALSLRADGVRLYGFTLSAATDVRRTTPEQSRVNVYRDESLPGLQTGNVLRGLTITDAPAQGAAHGAGAAGILIFGAQRFLVAENTVRRTLADGIHITGGSRQGWVLGNTVREAGDDLIATVSYRGDKAPVSDILMAGNDVAGGYWGRGIAVVGSQRVTVCGNHIARMARAAGVLVAQEGAEAADTPGASDIRIERNLIEQVQTQPPDWLPAGAPFADLRRRVLKEPRTGHGAIEVHAIGNAAGLIAQPAQAALRRVERVLIQHNRIDGVAGAGIRIGADSATGLVRDLWLCDNAVVAARGAPVQREASLAPQAVREWSAHSGGACISPAGTAAERVGARLEGLSPPW